MKKIIVLFAVLLVAGCSSLEVKAEKASVEVEGKKAEIGGFELKTEKKVAPKPE